MRCTSSDARCVLEWWMELPRPPEWLEREGGGGGGEEMRQGETDRDSLRVARGGRSKFPYRVQFDLDLATKLASTSSSKKIFFPLPRRMEIFSFLSRVQYRLVYKRSTNATLQLMRTWRRQTKRRRRSSARGMRCTGTAVNEFADPMGQSA